MALKTIKIDVGNSVGTDYPTVQLAIIGEAGPQLGDDLDWQMESSSGFADTTKVDFSGISDYASFSLTGDNDQPRWNNSAARLDVATSFKNSIDVGVDNLIFNGMQFRRGSGSSGTRDVLYLTGADVVINNSVVSVDSGVAAYGLTARNGCEIKNSIFFGAFTAHAIRAHGSSLLLVNNLIAGSAGNGIECLYGGGVVTAINTVSTGNALDWVTYSNPLLLTACASGDATGSVGLTSIPYDNTTFSSVSAGAENFSLAAGSLLIDAGVDASAWGVVDDIAGVARPQGGSYDIGPVEAVQSSGYDLGIGNLYSDSTASPVAVTVDQVIKPASIYSAAAVDSVFVDSVDSYDLGIGNLYSDSGASSVAVAVDQVINPGSVYFDSTALPVAVAVDHAINPVSMYSVATSGSVFVESVDGYSLSISITPGFASIESIAIFQHYVSSVNPIFANTSVDSVAVVYDHSIQIQPLFFDSKIDSVLVVEGSPYFVDLSAVDVDAVIDDVAVYQHQLLLIDDVMAGSQAGSVASSQWHVAGQVDVFSVAEIQPVFIAGEYYLWPADSYGIAFIESVKLAAGGLGSVLNPCIKIVTKTRRVVSKTARRYVNIL